jgi:hypothetical protein
MKRVSCLYYTIREQEASDKGQISLGDQADVDWKTSEALKSTVFWVVPSRGSEKPWYC